jgi:hypothetical protein
MISGIDLNATVDFILESDKENPTVWKLGVIPSYLFAKISGSGKEKEVDVAYQVLQLSLKGWDNFEIPYSKVKQNIFGRELEVVPLEILEKIPLKVITELTLKVLEINQVQGEERKN